MNHQPPGAASLKTTAPESINQTMGTKEWLLMVVLSTIWGGSFFFVGVAVRELPPLTIVWCRVGLAAVILLGMVIDRLQTVRFKKIDNRLVEFGGLLHRR